MFRGPSSADCDRRRAPSPAHQLHRRVVRVEFLRELRPQGAGGGGGGVGGQGGERLLEGVEGDFVAGQRLHFAIIVPVNGERVEVPTTGIIKSINQGRMVVLYFRPQPRHERYLRMAAKNLPIQPE